MTREERLAKDGVTNPLLFYSPRDSYGVFSNFSAHPVELPHPFTLEPTTYATTEHRYQAMKAKTAKEHDFVNAAKTAGESKSRGGPRGIELRPEWGSNVGDLCYLVMLECLFAKTVHRDFMDALLMSKATRSYIYEDSPTDDIWGWRYVDDHRGKNLLGLALMQVRKVMFP